MDLTRPLRSLVPSLDSAVLEVLAGTTRPLSGHQVAQLTRTGSVSGVRLVLRRLVEHGLATRDDRGRSSYFAANREHLAWPAIEDLLHLTVRLEQRIIETVEAWSIQPESLSIFGSLARHEAGPASDIDLLIIQPENTTDSAEWDTQLEGLATAVENWTGNRVQFTTLTFDGLAVRVRYTEPIIEAWLAEANTLVGTDIRALISRSTVGNAGSNGELH